MRQIDGTIFYETCLWLKQLGDSCFYTLSYCNNRGIICDFPLFCSDSKVWLIDL